MLRLAKSVARMDQRAKPALWCTRYCCQIIILPMTRSWGTLWNKNDDKLNKLWGLSKHGYHQGVACLGPFYYIVLDAINV
jgi:hypothetical protein